MTYTVSSVQKYLYSLISLNYSCINTSEVTTLRRYRNRTIIIIIIIIIIVITKIICIFLLFTHHAPCDDSVKSRFYKPHSQKLTDKT